MEILNIGRHDDAHIVVSQDNDKAQIKIAGIDGNAAKILGICPAEAQGLDFCEFLAPKTRQTILENVDFTDVDFDIGRALRRSRRIIIRPAQGEDTPVSVAVFSCHSEDRAVAGSVLYYILLRNSTLGRELDHFRNTFNNGLYAYCSLDEESGYLDHQGTMQTIEMLRTFDQHSTQSTDCIIGLAKTKDHKLRKIIADNIKNHIREEDIVGLYKEDGIIFVLLGCSLGSSAPQRILRVNKKQGIDLGISYSALGDKNLLTKLEQALNLSSEEPIQITPLTNQSH